MHGFGGYLPGSPLPTLIEILDGRSPANSDAGDPLATEIITSVSGVYQWPAVR